MIEVIDLVPAAAILTPGTINLCVYALNITHPIACRSQHAMLLSVTFECGIFWNDATHCVVIFGVFFFHQRWSKILSCIVNQEATAMFVCIVIARAVFLPALDRRLAETICPCCSYRPYITMLWLKFWAELPNYIPHKASDSGLQIDISSTIFPINRETILCHHWMIAECWLKFDPPLLDIGSVRALLGATSRES